MKNEPELSIWEKYSLFQFLCQFPMLSTMITRRKVGLRTFNDTSLAIITLIMLALAHVTGSKLMGAYALIFWGCGKWQAWNRWKELKAGEKWHTRSFGISLWEYAPLPQWLRDEDRIYRLVEPVSVYVVGMLTGLVDLPLGIWIGLSAVCARFFGDFFYNLGRQEMLDLHDASIIAIARNDAMQQAAPGAAPARPKLQSDPGSIGMSSGAGEDIRERVERNIAEAEARRHPVAEAMNQVKETAQTVKEAAEAVCAVKEATAAPERETIIIATADHTSETLVMVKETETFIPIAPERGIRSEPEATALTAKEREWQIVQYLYPSREEWEADRASLPEPPQLPAPPEEKEADKAA